MGRLPARTGIIARSQLRGRASTALDEVGLTDLSPDTIVERLPAATRQLVEIAKVLTADSVKVIVFDEPTTALTEAESERLLEHILRLRERGVAMLYVTHRLEEMFAIGDWVTVLRDGGLSEAGRCRLRRGPADHRDGRPGGHLALSGRATGDAGTPGCGSGDCAGRTVPSHRLRRRSRRDPRHRRAARVGTQRVAAVHLRRRTGRGQVRSRSRASR